MVNRVAYDSSMTSKITSAWTADVVEFAGEPQARDRGVRYQGQTLPGAVIYDGQDEPSLFCEVQWPTLSEFKGMA
jgi:hypothetical protein